MTYRCIKCDKCFTRKATLDQHIKNESCVLCEKIKCRYCDNLYASLQSMERHVRTTCKYKNDIADKQAIYEKLLELQDDVETLKKENSELKNVIKKNVKSGNLIQNGLINNGTITNNTINNNIVLIGYGKEDISKIQKIELVKGMKSGFYATVELLDAVHFNPNYPEFHNVYISSMKNKYAMMYDGSNWTLVMKDDLIDKLYSDKRNYIEENLDDFIDSLTTSQKKALDRWMDTGDDHGKIKQIKNKIKLLLYNKRDMVMDTKRLNATVTEPIEIPDIVYTKDKKITPVTYIPGSKRKNVRVRKN
jgi:hypothetical protein